MYNPWFKHYFDKTKFKLKHDNGIYTIIDLFSDGAGSYIAKWKTSKHDAIRSILSNEEEILIGYYNNF